MRSSLVVLLTLMLCGASAAQTLSSASAARMAEFQSAYAQAWMDGRLEPMLSHYAEQIRLMPEYHPTTFGRAHARAYFEALLQRFDVRTYAREPLQTFDLGSRIVQVGVFQTSIARRGGEEHQIHGKYIDIWEVGRDGTLMIATHGWNFDRYPSIAEELRFTGVPSVRTAFQPRVRVEDNLSFELAARNALQEAALIQRDDRIWAQFYADDALLLPNHAAAVQGRAKIDAYLSEHSKALSVFEKLDVRNDRIDRIDPQGRYVIDYASHVANWRNGDSSGVNTGKNVRIWRREPDGTLKMICQIGMYD